MAFTGVAALATAASTGAAVTATMVLSAVAEVGIAMTVVGAVTGSKDLIKIGGAMSLIGGVGGMIAGAAGAGAAAAGTSVAEGAAELGAAAAPDVAASVGESAMAGPASSSLELSGPEMAGEAMPQGIVGSSSPLIPPSTEMAQAVKPLADTGASAAATPPSINDVVSPATQSMGGAQAPVTPYDANPTDARLQAGMQSSPLDPSVAPQTSSSFFSQMSAFANNNKTLFSSGLQLLGGGLKGMNDRQMWDQKMALERDRMNRANSIGNFSPTPPVGIVQGARA